MLRVKGISAEVTTDVARVRQRAQEPRNHDDASLIIVSAGGDGTLSLVVQNTPKSTVLIPMPLGTENLLARHFGFVSDPQAIIRTMQFGHDHTIDAGSANGKLFLVMVTCGFDAEVVRAVHLRRRGHISRFSYFWPTLRTIRRYSFPTLQVRWQREGTDPSDFQYQTSPDETCCWAMVFNLPRYAASLPIEQAAKADDGRLDFCGLQRGGFLNGLRYLGGIVTGRHIHWTDVTRRSILRCRITSSGPVSYQLDGDYAGRLPIEIRILPKHVTLRLPPRNRETKS